MVRNQSRRSRVFVIAVLVGAMASAVYAGTSAVPAVGDYLGITVMCPTGSGVPCDASYGKRCDQADPGKTCKDVIGGCKCKG